LIGTFVVERLRKSRPLRVAVAASVLLHLTAVPVLAYLWLRPSAPERVLHFGVEPREDWALPEEVEPEREVSWPELEALEEPEAKNHARLLRYWLTRPELPEFPSEALRQVDAEGWADWLRLRSAWARGHRSATPAHLDASPTIARLDGADDLELLLWAEAWMDAAALEVELPGWAGRLWARVADPEQTGTSALALATRQRLLELGLAGPGLDRQGAVDESGTAIRPFRAAWTEALAGELARRGCASPAVERWLQGVVQ